MRSFSQRKGLTPIKEIFQIEDIDQDLKNALWNCLTIYYWDKRDFFIDKEGKDFVYLIKVIWINFFKEKLDEMSFKTPENIYKYKNFFFKAEWYRIYDFIEFIINNSDGDLVSRKDVFVDVTNRILERELSGYRIVENLITQITSKEELESIEDALNSTKKISPVKIHLERALQLLSDRKNPDYRNSIKESISAVESLCKLITGDKNATLGLALKKIEATHKIHPALHKSFSLLYGYTSDSDGIRHALLENEALKQEDAKYMLVSCSAFINYLQQKG